VLIGEIGGQAEENAADYLKNHNTVRAFMPCDLPVASLFHHLADIMSNDTGSLPQLWTCSDRQEANKMKQKYF